MNSSRNAETNRFFLTGSDFSELAILEKNAGPELNNAGGLAEHLLQQSAANGGEPSLKAAKFKKLDWNAMEKNLIK